MADLWLFGALLLAAPAYLQVNSGWEWPMYLLGFGALTLSFAGALTELGKLLKSEGLNYWGVGLVFLIPAVVLYLAAERHSVSSTVATPAKAGVLLLVALGGAMFFQGIPYFFWNKDGASPKGVDAHPAATVEPAAPREFKANRKAAANAIVAFLALATAVVTLIEKLMG